jgi:hypothetical protein
MSERAILALCIALAVLGWFALGSFTHNNPPVGWNLWAAAGILLASLWASFLPVLHRLHPKPRHGNSIMPRVVRRSGLSALYVTVCVGLRAVRALHWANAVLLLLLFVLTEVVLLTRQSP